MTRSWKFVFKRRGWQLESFVKGCETVDAAQEKFKRLGMIPPTEQELVDLGLEPPGAFSYPKDDKPPSKKAPAPVKKQKKASPKKVKDEESKEYDDILIVDA